MTFRIRIFIGLGALGLCGLAAWLIRPGSLGLIAVREGFSRRAEFSLLDSLPALSPGLGELEAFKLTADPLSKTNADRSVWLADSLGEISLEYYSGKTRFDSARFYVWTRDGFIASRVLKQGSSLRWRIPIAGKIKDWTEVVGVYISRPRLFISRAADTSVSAFEQIEGKILHVVRRGYQDRRESVVHPDTSYLLQGGELPQLLAKGYALAILNPFPNAVEWRIIRLSGKHEDICRVEGNSVHVYRTLLKNLEGPVLAYNSPGKTRALVFKEKRDPDFFFWLER